jgi:regulator of protease activity HflC (stomatin/prohibitin superfamily)
MGPLDIAKETYFGNVTVLAGEWRGLYPGVHFFTPLVEKVETFDLHDHLFIAGVAEEGAKAGEQKNGLSVQSREGLNIGLSVTVRYRLDPNKLANVQAHVPQPVDKELVPPVVASAWRELAPAYTVREIFSTKREEVREKARRLSRASLAQTASSSKR